MNYQLIVKGTDGGVRGEFVQFQELDFKHVLNKEGDCSFKISVKDPNANTTMIQLGQREVYVYRDNTIVWGGLMIGLTGSLTGGDDVLTINCKGFLERVLYRSTGTGR